MSLIGYTVARRRSIRFRAEMSAPMTVRARETDAQSGDLELGRKMREVRAIATVDSWGHASLTIFTTVRENGAAVSPRRESRCGRISHEMASLDACAPDGARVGGVCLGNRANSFRPWRSDRSVSPQIQSDSALETARRRRWHLQFGMHAPAWQRASRQDLLHRAGERPGSLMTQDDPLRAPPGRASCGAIIHDQSEHGSSATAA